VRTSLFALALLVAACGGERERSTSAANAPSVASSRGPDHLALRVPRRGGTPEVFAYPALDSIVWTGQGRVPALARVLAFDETGGALAALDSSGAPVHIDFRIGSVTRHATPRLQRVSSANGFAIFGIGAKGSVVRLTPGAGADWTHTPKLPVRDLLPQPGGALVLVADSADRTIVWQLQPPESRVAGSIMLEKTERALRTPVGDRVYLTSGDRLLAVRTRDLEPVPAVALPAAPRALVTSPSGDRVYVIADSIQQLFIIDRYSEQMVEGPKLPGFPRDLRMDPMGRYVLIRAAAGDSVWVLDVGTDRLTGAVRSAWRGDLPAVAPDGRIAVARGPDVAFHGGEQLAVDTVIAGGASDFWHFFSWDGFRPRLATQEEEPPVEPLPEVPDDTAPNPFAGQLATRDSAPPAPGDTAAHPVPEFAPQPAPAVEFTLQFSALRDEAAARELAREIRDARTSPRVMATVRVVATSVGESMVYRVIAGPFRTKDDAEAAGQQSGKPYWVYEGAP
jgi:cell division septation protein DedD